MDSLNESPDKWCTNVCVCVCVTWHGKMEVLSCTTLKRDSVNHTYFDSTSWCLMWTDRDCVRDQSCDTCLSIFKDGAWPFSLWEGSVILQRQCLQKVHPAWKKWIKMIRGQLSYEIYQHVCVILRKSTPYLAPLPPLGIHPLLRKCW